MGGVSVLRHPFPSTPLSPSWTISLVVTAVSTVLPHSHQLHCRDRTLPGVVHSASSRFQLILTKFTDGDAATWSEFLHFYSRGAWDPQKVPVMPNQGSRAPEAKRGPPLLSNPSRASQSPENSSEGSSEIIHHVPLTLGELTSSQLDDSSINTCSLPPRPSLFAQSVIPQGDNFESLGYLAAPFAPRMSYRESETTFDAPP